MDIRTTLSITEARKKIFDIAQKVQRPGSYYTLTEKGRPKAVILSAEEFESMIETMEVKMIFPDLDKDYAEVKRAMKTGEYKKWSTLEDLERKWALTNVAEKPKKKYGIRSANKTKSGKSSR